MRVRLVAHPSIAPAAVDGVTVEVESRDSELWLRCTIGADPDSVRWPNEAPAQRTDELWRTTCLEAFVATSVGYTEFNLSSSGQWASYRFDDYRQGMANATERAVIEGFDVGKDQAAFWGKVELPVGARRIGLSAVIEEIDGTITYWALAHPSDKPDFHHPDSFVLDLP